jgi:hypothetical protein
VGRVGSPTRQHRVAASVRDVAERVPDPARRHSRLSVRGEQVINDPRQLVRRRRNRGRLVHPRTHPAVVITQPATTVA